MFAIDVESYGLYGEGFAVGVSVQCDGKEIDSFFANCPLKQVAGYGSLPETEQWLQEHVIPTLPTEPTHPSPVSMRKAFWEFYCKYKDMPKDISKYGDEPHLIFIADCGTPVEARFFQDCVTDDYHNRVFKAPYPLLNLATLLYIRSENPIGTFPRHANELPAHHPLHDARQSARLWFEHECALWT